MISVPMVERPQLYIACMILVPMAKHTLWNKGLMMVVPMGEWPLWYIACIIPVPMGGAPSMVHSLYVFEGCGIVITCCCFFFNTSLRKLVCLIENTHFILTLFRLHMPASQNLLCGFY